MSKNGVGPEAWNPDLDSIEFLGGVEKYCIMWLEAIRFCTLWGRAWELSNEKDMAGAAEWLAKQVVGVLKMSHVADVEE